MSTRWNTSGRLVLLAAPTVLAVVSGTALAASPWSTTGDGFGTAKSGGITAPGAPTVPGSTVTNGSVAVSWSGATGPAGATLKYLVERLVGTTSTAVCASTFAAPITGTSCTDTSVPNGTYKYRVTTRLGGDWEAVSAESPAVIVSSLTITSPVDGNQSFGRNPSPATAGTGTVGAGYGTTVTATLKQGTTTIQSATPAVNQGTGVWSYATSCLAKNTNYVLTVTQTTPSGSQSATSAFKTSSANPNC